MESNNDFSQKLFSLWRKSIEAYEKGLKNFSNLFDQEEMDFLKSNGMRPQDLYDYAEDFVADREPDFAIVLLIQEIRRDYFLNEQKGVASEKKLERETFPDKSNEFEGVVGFPRTFEKARAKLHGELPLELAYSCPLDRRFLKDNNVHPAEFLRAVWFYEKNPTPKDGLVKWVKHRSKKGSPDFLDSIKNWFR